MWHYMQLLKEGIKEYFFDLSKVTVLLGCWLVINHNIFESKRGVIKGQVFTQKVYILGESASRQKGLILFYSDSV